MTAEAQRHGLLLDIQGSQSVAHGERGIARYVMEHAMALIRRSDRVRGLLLNPLQPFPGHLPSPLLSSPLLQWSTATAVRHYAAEESLAFHIMSPFELPDPATTILPPHLMDPAIPLIVTLYDLIPLLMQDRYLADPAWKKRYMQRVESVRSADLILAISEATRQDAIEALDVSPERIVNIQGGVGPEFSVAPAGVDPIAEVRSRLPEIRRPYVFTVAGAEYRKNTERLLDAWGALPAPVRAAHQLVITCALPAGWRDSWMDHARKAGCNAGDVVLTDRVDDPMLVRLYRGTRLFVFPSLYEGFGLPVAEAIACGAPAVTSNVSSLPEILEDPAATFDPSNVDDMSNVIGRALDDSAFLGHLQRVAGERAPAFTWDAVADRSLAAVAATLDRPFRSGRRPLRRRRRLRVALATPLPPEQSGIANYSARLIPQLAERVDLDVLYANRENSPSVRWPGVQVLPVAGLGRYLNPHGYNAILYAMGNSPSHIATYEAATRYPGIVWFHDVKLPHLYWHRAAAVGIHPHDAIRDQLRRYYVSRAPEHAVERWSIPLVDRFGLSLTPELAQGARGVIVHSPFAERLLRLDQGGDMRCPPIAVVSHAAAPPRPEGPVRRVSPPVVGSLGLVDERKSPLLLIDAVAAIPAERRPRLVFVGPCEDWKRDWLLEHAAQGGVADLVEVIGWVSAGEWQRCIEHLTCAVQLRVGTNGESAGSIRDAMGSGVPVISNMIAVGEEFPAGSLVSLPSDAGAKDIAAQIDRVCHDPIAWAELSEAGWRYTETVSPDVVVDQILAAIEATVADQD